MKWNFCEQELPVLSVCAICYIMPFYFFFFWDEWRGSLVFECNLPQSSEGVDSEIASDESLTLPATC